MIRVDQAGLQSAIQDGGRYGYQHIGVTPGGVMDWQAYQLGNLIVGNQLNAPCIEVAYGGLELTFDMKTEIAITGAAFTPRINGKAVPMYETLYVIPGDHLVLGYASAGVYGYVTLACGLKLEKILGSASTDFKSGIGGIDGQKLLTGGMLETYQARRTMVKKRCVPEALRTPVGGDIRIGVLPGMELERFSEDSWDQLLHASFEIDPSSDRMGYRLKGHASFQADSHDIISCGLARGTIQATSGGALIVMMADHQTTGGYTRLANVISADFPALAQMRPGQTLRFYEMTLEEAHGRLREMKTAIETWLTPYLDAMVSTSEESRQYRITFNHQTYVVQVSKVEE
ncbi:MAG: biotin-dependent carboxyltransferase family protein [Clostridia bacterium]|nr:biotin-dependent carboxyltransferase family protein [Clostridia bacterium]